MKTIKNQPLLNFWSFILTLICIALVTLWTAPLDIPYDFLYVLLLICALTFFIGVFGIPFETRNKKQLLRSVISLIFSFVMCIYLLYALIAPIFFPFGIPPF